MRLPGGMPVLAGCLALIACDGPAFLQLAANPLSVLEVALVPAVDTMVPGYPLPVTILVWNPSTTPIEISGGGSTVGFDVFRPTGEVVPSAVGRELYLKTWTVGPHDTLAIPGVWRGVGGSVLDPVPEVALPPGTYRLRPYIDAWEGRRKGEATEVSILPWTVARFAHTEAGLPEVDFVVGGRGPAASVAPGFSSMLRVVRAGRQLVELRAHGDSTTLGSAEIVFVEGVTNTVAVAAGPAPVGLTDTATATGPEESRLRVVQLAAAAPPLDVFLRRPESPDPIPVLTPFPYGVTSPYLSGTGGSWTAIVTATNGADTLMRTAAMPIPGGQVRTLLLMDDGKGGVLGLLIEP